MTATPPPRRKALASLAWLLLTSSVAPALLSPLPARAQGSQAPATLDEALAERRVKAAYLYRFAGYAQWPDGAFARADSPLVIGVWGNDELADDLQKLVADRVIEGRRIEVRKIRDGELGAPMHILFVGRQRTGRLADRAESAPPHGTLVVSESAGALRQGSVINFLLSDGQIRFELSLETAERYGLRLSSRLVAVAQNSPGKTVR